MRIEGVVAEAYAGQIRIATPTGTDLRGGPIVNEWVVITPANEDPGAEAVAEYLRELKEKLMALRRLEPTKTTHPKVWVLTDDMQFTVGWNGYRIVTAADPLTAASLLETDLKPEQQKPVEEMTVEEKATEVYERTNRDYAPAAKFLPPRGPWFIVAGKRTWPFEGAQTQAEAWDAAVHAVREEASGWP